MRFCLFSMLAAGLVVTAAGTAQNATNPAPPQVTTPGPAGAAAGPAQDGQRVGRGWGAGMMGGSRGVMGTVTEAEADHFTVKNEAGEIYTVHVSPNTRILRQPPPRQGEGAERTPPQTIKSSDIKVGDAIAANGEVDAGTRSVGAVLVVQLDPERAREMKEMQANFGKTWLMGRVIAVHDVKIVLQSPVDGAPHTFVANENTTFRKRRVPITLADVQEGDSVRVEGALKEGIFMATTVNVMGMPSARGGPAPRPGPPAQ